MAVPRSQILAKADCFAHFSCSHSFFLLSPTPSPHLMVRAELRAAQSWTTSIFPAPRTEWMNKMGSNVSQKPRCLFVCCRTVWTHVNKESCTGDSGCRGKDICHVSFFCTPVARPLTDRSIQNYTSRCKRPTTRMRTAQHQEINGSCAIQKKIVVFWIGRYSESPYIGVDVMSGTETCLNAPVSAMKTPYFYA